MKCFSLAACCGMMVMVGQGAGFAQDKAPPPPPIKMSAFEGYRVPIDASYGLEPWTGYAYGEFLYWKAVTGELDFVYTDVPGTSTTSSVAGYGDLQAPSYSWDPGFRLGLGVRFPHDAWELFGEYAYFQNEGSSAYEIPVGNLDPRTSNDVKQMVGSYPSGHTVYKARSSLDLEHHAANLLLARRSLYSDQIIFRLLVGATGGWIDQTQDMVYTVSVDNQGTPEDQFFVGKQKWSFHGGGVRCGFDSDWYMGYGFSFLGQCTAGLLYGRYEGSLQMENRGTDENATDVDVSDIRTNVSLGDKRLMPHLQVKFGPSWGMIFEDFGLNLYALYELNSYFNVNYTFRSHELSEHNTDGVSANIRFDAKQSTHSSSVFGIQGLTLGLRADF